LRICPVLDLAEADAAGQFNVEYRTCDGAASPYLALGAVVWAGVDGVRKRLALPDGAGPPLPTSLATALDALQSTPEAADWFGTTYLEAYLMHKRAEARSLNDLDEVAQCARYALTY
jgi:glutamine synthetase